jgi:hypothetical protein
MRTGKVKGTDKIKGGRRGLISINFYFFEIKKGGASIFNSLVGPRSPQNKCAPFLIPPTLRLLLLAIVATHTH